MKEGSWRIVSAHPLHLRKSDRLPWAGWISTALFLAIVTWLAARMAAQGTISIGQLVSVYGYVAILALPVSNLIEDGYNVAHGLVVSWRVRLAGPTPDLKLGVSIDGAGGASADARNALKGERRAYFPELDGFHPTAVYDRYALKPGHVIEGPALIEEAESTCVLGAGDRAAVDERLNLVIDVAELRA